MEKQWRLILDGKHDGYYNMAVDEAILLNYPLAKTPTLRIYGWKFPFISLGYNQIPQNILRSREIPFVRRITGGSAIFHHKEVTYSLVCARRDLDLSPSVKQSYREICRFLRVFYGRLGLRAYFARESPGGLPSVALGRYGNFCFSAWQHFDLVIRGKKIGGNAQKRKRDIIFQQGSIPQEIDFGQIQRFIKTEGDLSLRAAALSQFTENRPGFSFLGRLLAESFKTAFNVELKKETLFYRERERVRHLLAEKYASRAWNEKS